MSDFGRLHVPRRRPQGTQPIELDDFAYLKGLYLRASRQKSEKSWERANQEFERLPEALSEPERRSLVKISQDAGAGIGVKKYVLKLGKFGEIGREKENR